MRFIRLQSRELHCQLKPSSSETQPNEANVKDGPKLDNGTQGRTGTPSSSNDQDAGHRAYLR